MRFPGEEADAEPGDARRAGTAASGRLGPPGVEEQDRFSVPTRALQRGRQVGRER